MPLDALQAFFQCSLGIEKKFFFKNRQLFFLYFFLELQIKKKMF